jgi:Zn-dependent peptidase ImmA (M78 family)
MANRRALLLDAATAAAESRDRVGLDQIAPIDVYQLAQNLGVSVRFIDVSMEGFYQKGPPPRVLLSALRPLPRRAYTCAHELGHHWFGHGSRIDELQGDERHTSDIPEEILAEGFGGFLLMPTIGLRGAFARRGWSIPDASPTQMLTIAGEFGVGYATLTAHLTYMVRDLTDARRKELERWTPQRIRKEVVGDGVVDALLIMDEASRPAVIDLEVGHGLAVPHSAELDGDAIEHVKSFPTFELYRGRGRGLAELNLNGRSIRVGVAPQAFVGRAIHRHLEDPDE